MAKKINRILYSSKFINAFRKIPQKIKEKAVKKEKIFRLSCFDSRLKTHKLKGKYSNYYSFSITNSYRIIFEFYKEGVIFVDIGTHEFYK